MADDRKDAHMHTGHERQSVWVARFAQLIPPGEVLDLACGTGRHSRLLAAQGHAVLAVDRNAEALALAAGAGIRTQQVDLESDGAGQWPFAENRFAGIVVTNYLHRPLWTAMIGSLAADGVLIYETFASGNEQFGKPSNPDFLLRRGELLEVARRHALQVLAFEEGYVAEPRPAMVQRICMFKSNSALAPANLRLI